MKKNRITNVYEIVSFSVFSFSVKLSPLQSSITLYKINGKLAFQYKVIPFSRYVILIHCVPLYYL